MLEVKSCCFDMNKLLYFQWLNLVDIYVLFSPSEIFHQTIVPEMFSIGEFGPCC